MHIHLLDLWPFVCSLLVFDASSYETRSRRSGPNLLFGGSFGGPISAGTVAVTPHRRG